MYGHCARIVVVSLSLVFLLVDNAYYGSVPLIFWSARKGFCEWCESGRGIGGMGLIVKVSNYFRNACFML